MTRAGLPLLVAACLAGCTAPSGSPARWSAPVAEPAVHPLPRLARPLALDGDLAEWPEAPRLALRSPVCIAWRLPPHQWRGPADAGLEVRPAWTPEGLALAVVVTDDDVRNALEGDNVRYQDCVEVLVDPQGLRNRRAGAGFLKFLLRPPVGDRPAELLVADRPGEKFEGLKAGSRRTADGWAAELLIPWGILPGFRAGPGAELGLFFRLDDYDARDGENRQPLRLSFRGAADLSGDGARKMSRWVLAEPGPPPADQAFELFAGLKLPAVVLAAPAAPIVVEVDARSPAVEALRLVVTDSSGRRLLDRTVLPEKVAAPWGATLRIAEDWTAGLADGVYAVGVAGIGADRRELGWLVRPAAVAGGACREALDRLLEADLPALSRREPFRAADWLAVAVAVERLKRSAEIGDVANAASAAREIRARLNLLRSGKPGADDTGLYRLVALAADPESQVVLEYPWTGSASVGFHCGSFPLAVARVSQHLSRREALAALRAEGGPLASLAHDAEIGGFPARIEPRTYRWSLARLEAFAPERQLLVATGKFSGALVMDAALLPLVRAEAAVILPGCPENLTQRIIDWAAVRGTPILSLEDAKLKDPVLVAGDIAKEFPAYRLQTMRAMGVHVEDKFAGASLAAGNLVISVEHPSRAVAERAALLVARGRPVTPAEVDGLRAELVKALAPPGAAGLWRPDASRRLFVGDLHAHTFYSDGQPSPVGLALEAISARLDYVAITDHNAVAGGQLARRLLAEHGFRYPLVVGQELTTPWAHLNAYPLNNLISPALPLEKMVEAAHAQGAAIQWNHPSYGGSDWQRKQMPSGLAGTGLDAWEHYPKNCDDLKTKGKVPTLIGGTDTHDGTFALPERTIIWSAAAGGAEIAAAVRAGQVAAILPEGAGLLYGPPEMVNLVWAALADGRGLKAAKAEQLRIALEKADVVGLIRASPPGLLGPERP